MNGSSFVKFWTLGRTCKFIPAPWYKRGGWTPHPPPPLKFLICCSISKRFYLQRKAFDLLYKMKVFFMGGGAAWGLWFHQQWSLSWPPSWSTKEWKTLKTSKNGDFFVLQMKNNTEISTLHGLRRKIYFYCWRKLNKHVLSLKNGLTTS